MKNNSIEDKCHCPMECDYISYSFSVVSTPFNPEEMCPNNPRPQDPMREFYDYKSPPKFVGKLIQFRKNISAQDADYCMRNIMYRAEVNFRLATNSLSVTIMSRRLSFFDKMSSFGNILCIIIVINFIMVFMIRDTK